MVTGLMITVMVPMRLIRVQALIWEQMAINKDLEMVHIKAMRLIRGKALILEQATIREAMDSLEAIKDHSILRILVGHSIQTRILMEIMLQNHTLVTNTKKIMIFLLIKEMGHNQVLMVSLQIMVLKMVLLGSIGMVIQTSDHLLHLSVKFILEEDILHPTVILGVPMVQIPINTRS